MIILTILTWENYYMGIIANLLIFHWVSQYFGGYLRKWYREIKNRVGYRYFGDDERKKRYDEVRDFLTKLNKIQKRRK